MVTPSVENSRVRFSADLWNPGSATDARIEFTVSPDSATAGEEERFTHECRLSAADRGVPELSSQSQRIDCEFDWPAAHRWTYDDPFLYNVCARLYVGDDKFLQPEAQVDQPNPALLGGMKPTAVVN